MKKLRFILVAVLMLFISVASVNAQPQRPLRTIIPPPLPVEKETPAEAQENEKTAPKAGVENATPPESEEEEEVEPPPAEPTEEEKAAEEEKARTAKEAEEARKQRELFLKEVTNLVVQMDNLRLTVDFGGGYWEEFRKQLLEAAFALNRVRITAPPSMMRSDTLGLLETALQNFVRAKEAWEMSKAKRDEANHAYQRAEDMFPDTYRRYYRESREPAIESLDQAGAPWIKDYFEFKKMGDNAKRESEQLLQQRDVYVSSAYSTLDAAKEALRREIRQ